MVFCLLLFILNLNSLTCEDNIKWEYDDEHIYNENFLDFGLNLIAPIVTSNESNNGFSHFNNIKSLYLSYGMKLNNKYSHSFGINFSIYYLSTEYLLLIDNKQNSNFYSIDFKYNYKFVLSKSKKFGTLYLNSILSPQILFGENLKSEKKGGFNFSNYGFAISTGPNLSIILCKELNLNIGAEISFSYIGQILFYPNFNISLTNWIN